MHRIADDGEAAAAAGADQSKDYQPSGAARQHGANDPVGDKPQVRPRMVKIKDIAARSGSSIATVSRVINKSGYVSEAVRKRVLRAAKDLDYQPNAGARLIRSGRSGIAGILLPSLDVFFFSTLAQALEQELFRREYRALICCTAEDPEHEKTYVSMLLAQKVDGVIAASVHSQAEHFARLAKAGIPIVAVDRALPAVNAPLVSVDHREGGRMLARHLIELGHRHIGVVGGPRHTGPIFTRAEGVVEVCLERDLPKPPVFLGEDHSLASCHAQADELFAGHGDRITAVAATSDVAAIGVLHAAHSRGIPVPERLSVIGFDNVPTAAYMLPPLTTIAQPMDEIGRAAVERLIGMITGEPEPDVALDALPLRLVRRESTMEASDRQEAGFRSRR